MDTKLQEYIDQCCERYLSIRPRSVYEMRTYLKRKLIRKELEPDFQEKVVEETLDRLQEEERLSDEAFVRWYVAEKNYFKPRGRIRLRHDLGAKGISSDLLTQILEENAIPDTDLITQLFETKYRGVDLSDKETMEKLIARLQRQGFQYHNIKTAIEDWTKKE